MIAYYGCTPTEYNMCEASHGYGLFIFYLMCLYLQNKKTVDAL